MIERLDSFLIDKVFQRVADWLGRTVGRSCYWAGAQLICLGLVCAFVSTGLRTHFAVANASAPPVISLLILPFWILLWCRIYREAARREEARGIGLNPLRPRFAGLRSALLVFVPISLSVVIIDAALAELDERSVAMWATLAEDLAETGALYLIACDGGAAFRRRVPARALAQGAGA